MRSEVLCTLDLNPGAMAWTCSSKGRLRARPGLRHATNSTGLGPA